MPSSGGNGTSRTAVAPSAALPFESPVNIPSNVRPINLSGIVSINFAPSVPTDIINNGHQIQIQYPTNNPQDSITLGGGESLDAILDTSGGKPDGTAYQAGEVYYLYTPQLDHLSNDAENFGGMMTEVHICNTVTGSTHGNICN